MDVEWQDEARFVAKRRRTAGNGPRRRPAAAPIIEHAHRGDGSRGRHQTPMTFDSCIKDKAVSFRMTGRATTFRVAGSGAMKPWRANRQQ